MRYTKYIGLIAVGLIALSGCSKIRDFGDTNISPTLVEKPSSRALLTNAQQNLPGLFAGNDFNSISLAQYISEGPYITYSGYANITPGTSYTGFYTSPLIQLKTIIDFNNTGRSEADAGANGSKNNQLAVARIMKAFIFWKLTDRWGDLPYSEALQGNENITPKFDKQENIYKDIFKELKEAAAQIDGGLAVKGDIILGGDMAAWKRFAATQRLIMALRMSKVYPAAGQLAAQEFALALPDAISSNAQNIVYKYISGDPNNSNPWYNNYTVSNRNDYAISLTLVNIMKANGSGTDPRLPKYGEVLPGGVIGLQYGRTTAINIPNAFSKIGDSFRGQGSPLSIFTFSQVCFAKAEAAKRGWIAGGDASAEGYYNDGIDANLAQNGVADATFKTQTGIVYNPATGYEQIATQRYVASYLDGFEAWAEWRRTGYPTLVPGPNATIPAIPRRLVYPSSDKTTNGDNYIAVVAQQGADNTTTRIWWDK
ncbi:MAG: SusD/RagB family nutrient-binding outer membrane lipoprotein [Bacteroidota bacterium]